MQCLKCFLSGAIVLTDLLKFAGSPHIIVFFKAQDSPFGTTLGQEEFNSDQEPLDFKVKAPN